MKNKKFAYLFFHLNLFFSSLPKNKRSEVINKIVELKKGGNQIYTYNLVKELKEFGEPYDIINTLIENKFIERIVEEKVDICSFDTKKIDRILKLKNLSS